MTIDLNKELKKITNKLRILLKKEENLVNLKLEGKISDSIYNEKYNELSLEKEYLAEEKVNVEITLKSEIDVKKRLAEFKQLLSSQKMLTEFDRTVFESIVEKIIVGGVNSDGEIDPAMLTIIFKTGETQNKDGKQFKSKRKNAKLEPDKLCPQNCDEDKKIVFSRNRQHTLRQYHCLYELVEQRSRSSDTAHAIIVVEWGVNDEMRGNSEPLSA